MRSEQCENSEHKKKRRVGRDANDFISKVTEGEINLELPKMKGRLIDWLDPEVVRWCEERMESLGIKSGDSVKQNTDDPEK